ncbi:unnamed protein product [Symbiodinium sp. CCMP2592]|nr:unnamed protein product [Symbiodinium sp. CCMP2592]
MASRPRRGPKRQAGSTCKQRCCYKNCRSQTDVKNSSFSLPVRKVDQTKARTMHKSAKVARFCSKRHLDMTKGKRSARRPYGQRESLSQTQVAHLFGIMCCLAGAPWAAVMLLISVSTGERVDAVRQICTDWLSGLQPEEVGKPTITWPDVNLKTTARCSVLDAGVATLLWHWISKRPLCSDKNDSQWPWPAQELQRDMRERTSSYLFPGQMLGGKHERNPHRPVTARAYNYVWEHAQKILKAQIDRERSLGRAHCFEDVDLSKLSSHCGKKSCVNMLSESGNPISVASALTATTPSVLQNCYIAQAPPEVQRLAVQGMMGGVVSAVQGAKASTAATTIRCKSCSRLCRPEDKFCGNCGIRLETTIHCNSCSHLCQPEDKFCCNCGSGLAKTARS